MSPLWTRGYPLGECRPSQAPGVPILGLSRVPPSASCHSEGPWPSPQQPPRDCSLWAKTHSVLESRCASGSPAQGPRLSLSQAAPPPVLCPGPCWVGRWQWLLRGHLGDASGHLGCQGLGELALKPHPREAAREGPPEVKRTHGFRGF